MKWYKGSYEFYRFESREYPNPKKFFTVPKLFVDVSRNIIAAKYLKHFNLEIFVEFQESACDERTVVLRDVHADMSGYYKCEVTTAELYEMVERKHYIQVVRKF